nr:ORF I polyprotein [Ipomoea batatas]
MEFHRPSLRKELDLSVEKDLIKFLTWFYPLKYWKKLCQDGPEFFTVHLHREVTAWVSRFLEGHAEPFMKIYEQHMESIMVREEDYPESQRYIFAQNKVIPKEIWPREGIQPDVRQDDEIYYERIKSARNQYYYELSQAKKGKDIWSQDPWNFDDIDSVLEEVEKIEKAYAQKSRKKRPEDKSQWNKDVWRTKRRQSGMDRQEWVNYMGYPSYSNYSTESDTASDEDSGHVRAILSYQFGVLYESLDNFIKVALLYVKKAITLCRPHVQDWPEELNWIFWYLCHEYHILMEFHRPSLRKELDLSVEKDLIKFLTWFYPLKYWKKLCQDGPEFFTVHLHREVTAWVSRFLEGHAEPFMKIYEQHMESIMVREEDYPESQRYIFAQNKVIPKEIWPREGIQPDVRQEDEIYYERIKSARNQYYYELSQAKKGEDIWSQDPWNFDDIDSVLEEVEKIEKAYAQKSRKKRPEDKSQWNKDVWRTKRRQSGMDRQEWVNYMGYPSYSNYSTESDTASDEDSVMDLQFRGEWMIMKASQPGWDSQSWKGKRFMKEG